MMKHQFTNRRQRLPQGLSPLLPRSTGSASKDRGHTRPQSQPQLAAHSPRATDSRLPLHLRSSRSLREGTQPDRYPPQGPTALRRTAPRTVGTVSLCLAEASCSVDSRSALLPRPPSRIVLREGPRQRTCVSTAETCEPTNIIRAALTRLDAIVGRNLRWSKDSTPFVISRSSVRV